MDRRRDIPLARRLRAPAILWLVIVVVCAGSFGCANGPLRRGGLFGGPRLFQRQGLFQGQGPLRRMFSGGLVGDVGRPEDLDGFEVVGDEGFVDGDEFVVDGYPVGDEFPLDGVEGEFIPMPNSGGPTWEPGSSPSGEPAPAETLPGPTTGQTGRRRLFSRFRERRADATAQAHGRAPGQSPSQPDDSLPRAAEHPRLRRIRPVSRLIPTNDADWAPEFAKVATCDFQDDGTIDLKNVRNATWLTGEDCVVEWRDQQLDLNDLKTVDFIIVPFNGMTEIAHTMVSFGFGHGDYVGVSVEVRKKRGQRYSTTSGFLNEYELCYVVADERDLLPVRVLQRESQVYVYRSTATPDQVRRLFVDMMERANHLAERPEFYNTITNNCTTNLVTHVNRLRPGKIPYDYRVLLPGYSDQLMYDLGLIENRLPFAEVKQRALLTERIAKSVEAPDFSARIRR